MFTRLYNWISTPVIDEETQKEMINDLESFHRRENGQMALKNFEDHD